MAPQGEQQCRPRKAEKLAKCSALASFCQECQDTLVRGYVSACVCVFRMCHKLQNKYVLCCAAAATTTTTMKNTTSSNSYNNNRCSLRKRKLQSANTWLYEAVRWGGVLPKGGWWQDVSGKSRGEAATVRQERQGWAGAHQKR